MSETKEEIAAERDALRAEVERLRGQVAMGGRVAPVQHQFVLSEGHRQELELNGVVNVGGRLLTADQVREALGPDQRDTVEIADVPEERRPKVPPRREGAVAGVDFVYPSVQPGGIDPAVAGTPGISGPPATSGARE